MKKRFVIFVILTIILLTPMFVLAQETTITLNQKIPGLEKTIRLGKGQNPLGLYISAWYKFIIGTIGIIATVMIMWAGFKWLTSRGNSTAIKSAQEIMWSAVIGLSLAFLSYTILNIINPDLLNIGIGLENFEELEEIESTTDISKCKDKVREQYENALNDASINEDKDRLKSIYESELKKCEEINKPKEVFEYCCILTLSNDTKYCQRAYKAEKQNKDQLLKIEQDCNSLKNSDHRDGYQIIDTNFESNACRQFYCDKIY